LFEFIHPPDNQGDAGVTGRFRWLTLWFDAVKIRTVYVCPQVNVVHQGFSKNQASPRCCCLPGQLRRQFRRV